MAVLGYNTIAGTIYNLSGGARPMISNVVVAPSSGTATLISASVDPFAGTADFLLGLFEWNSGTSLWDRLDEVLVSGVASSGTSTPFTISGAISASIVSGRTYRITCLGSAGYNERYDTLAGSETASFDDYFASFATGATLTPAQFTDYTPYFSTLWVDYTVAGSGYTLSASKGSFSETGKDASLLAGRKVSAEKASFTETGKVAELKVGRYMSASQGSLSLTGKDATLTVTGAGSYTLSASTGSFILTGKPAELKAGRLLSAAKGSISETGKAADLLAGRKLSAEKGSITLTGKPASLLKQYRLASAGGSFLLTGHVATLQVGAAVVIIGTLKKWNGAAWVPHKINRYYGQDVSMHPLKVYEDSQWKTVIQAD